MLDGERAGIQVVGTCVMLHGSMNLIWEDGIVADCSLGVDVATEGVELIKYGRVLL